MHRFNADDEARVLVLTGAGDKAFCAGGDLKEMSETGLTVPPPDFAPQFGRNIEVAKPTIAAVNGIAYAGGFLLAQQCDLVVAAEHATFAVSEVRVGRGSPWAAPLSWLVPPRVALQILLTGDPLDAERAREVGLVNDVVPAADLRRHTQALAMRIAANAPLSVLASKRTAYLSAHLPLEQAYDAAERLWEPVNRSEDAQEGPLAFRENEPPSGKDDDVAIGMADLVQDLRAETAELRRLLVDLPEGPGGWDLPTPADSWSIRDQITHLAFFDDAALLSAAAPERFTSELVADLLSGHVTPDSVARDHQDLPGTAVLAWFDRARNTLSDTFAVLDPARRVPWFGPSMSAASSLTARLMETWAHGQDVADALLTTRTPTARLRHVVHIGVGARAFSYLAHDREGNTHPVRVELTAPDGSAWTWGPAEASDSVTGSALDFALLVTQRRHRDDTTLVARGAVADEWLSIAQSFAGPPGAGRAPGQFSKEAP